MQMTQDETDSTVEHMTGQDAWKCASFAFVAKTSKDTISVLGTLFFILLQSLPLSYRRKTKSFTVLLAVQPEGRHFPRRLL